MLMTADLGNIFLMLVPRFSLEIGNVDDQNRHQHLKLVAKTFLTTVTNISVTEKLCYIKDDQGWKWGYNGGSLFQL